MKTSTIQRAGGALVAAMLVAPLGIGGAVADDATPAPTPTAEESAETPEVTIEAPLAELPGADEGKDGTEEGTPAPEATAPVAPEATPAAPPAADEPGPDQIITQLWLESMTYPTMLTWLPSGVYSATLTDLQMDGYTADRTRVPDLTMDRWEYSVTGGPWTEFTPVDRAATVPGLVTGENTIDVTGVYDQDGDGVPLYGGDQIEVVVQSLAEWLEEAEADTTLPRSESAQGTSTVFEAGAGFFGAGESVVITLVPLDGGAPQTFATTAAAADGSLEHTLTVPADLPLGTYYVVAEGQDGHTLGIHRMTVVAGQAAPEQPAAPAPEQPATGGGTNGSSVLATTGAEPMTGLLAAGALALVGAAAATGAARARAVRAARR